MTLTANPPAIEPILTDAEVRQFHELGYVIVKGVLSPEEAAYYRDRILDMVPRDLSIPAHWHVSGGRIKPYTLNGTHTIDLPVLMPIYANERLYRAMAQLHGEHRLRIFDGSIGITLRNDAGEQIRSQGLHLDASVPKDVDFLFTPEELQLGGCLYFTKVEERGGGIHIVPGGPRRVEEICRKHGKGARALYHNWGRIDDFPDSIEVTGDTGDFALLHHLMPHAASHNRRPQPRVAMFLRTTRVDHAHYPWQPVPESRYSPEQLSMIPPLGRKLLGLDPWE
jgi:ectoine hydroxylase-related dioxygenase (phytanoyl-CoA dioxygenase family)